MHVCFSSIYHLVFDEARVLSSMQQKRKIIYILDHGDETAVKETFADLVKIDITLSITVTDNLFSLGLDQNMQHTLMF